MLNHKVKLTGTVSISLSVLPLSNQLGRQPFTLSTETVIAERMRTGV